MIEGIDARDLVVFALCMAFVVGIFWANRTAETDARATEDPRDDLDAS